MCTPTTIHMALHRSQSSSQVCTTTIKGAFIEHPLNKAMVVSGANLPPTTLQRLYQNNAPGTEDTLTPRKLHIAATFVSPRALPEGTITSNTCCVMTPSERRLPARLRVAPGSSYGRQILPATMGVYIKRSSHSFVHAALTPSHARTRFEGMPSDTLCSSLQR
jgi:hypothetical protein